MVQRRGRRKDQHIWVVDFSDGLYVCLQCSIRWLSFFLFLEISLVLFTFSFSSLSLSLSLIPSATVFPFAVHPARTRSQRYFLVIIIIKGHFHDINSSVSPSTNSLPYICLIHWAVQGTRYREHDQTLPTSECNIWLCRLHPSSSKVLLSWNVDSCTPFPRFNSYHTDFLNFHRISSFATLTLCLSTSEQKSSIKSLGPHVLFFRWSFNNVCYWLSSFIFPPLPTCL